MKRMASAPRKPPVRRGRTTAKKGSSVTKLLLVVVGIVATVMFLSHDATLETEVVPDVRSLRGLQRAPTSSPTEKPITVAEMTDVLQRFVSGVHATFIEHSADSREEVWEAYVGQVEEHLEPFERKYAGKGVTPLRQKGEIFVSIAAYRDDMLSNTLKELFLRAKDPTKIYAGVVMQNCNANCRTGVQVVSKKGEKTRTAVSDAPPDPDGVAEFCATELGQVHCAAGRVRVLPVQEQESLGPAFARYLASKLWFGEEFFMQIDAHIWFIEGWDDALKAALRATPSFPKSVISTYPPSYEGHWQGKHSGRLCGSEFSTSAIEDHIIRLDSGAVDHVKGPTPPYATFVAAGFFAAQASFLIDAPYDPYLPFVFMGEELLLTAKFWTNGWDVYAPVENICAHQYRPGRMGLPKFWETTARTFNGRGGFNDRIGSLIINRIKYVVGYLDAKTKSDSVIVHLNDQGGPNYGLGTKRSLEAFLLYSNINMMTMKAGFTEWCIKGRAPPEDLRKSNDDAMIDI